VTLESFEYPTEMKITLPNGKIYVVKADFGTGLFINNTGKSSLEIPGNLYDGSGSKLVGNGFLEINGATPASTLSNRLPNLAGSSNGEYIQAVKKYLHNPFVLSRRIVAVLIPVIVLVLLFGTIAVPFVYVSHRRKTSPTRRIGNI